MAAVDTLPAFDLHDYRIARPFYSREPLSARMQKAVDSEEVLTKELFVEWTLEIMTARKVGGLTGYDQQSSASRKDPETAHVSISGTADKYCFAVHTEWGPGGSPLFLMARYSPKSNASSV